MNKDLFHSVNWFCFWRALFFVWLFLLVLVKIFFFIFLGGGWFGRWDFLFLVFGLVFGLFLFCFGGSFWFLFLQVGFLLFF